MSWFRKKKVVEEVTEMQRFKEAIDTVNELIHVLPKGYSLWNQRDWPRPQKLLVVRWNPDAGATPVYDSGAMDCLVDG